MACAVLLMIQAGSSVLVTAWTSGHIATLGTPPTTFPGTHTHTQPLLNEYRTSHLHTRVYCCHPDIMSSKFIPCVLPYPLQVLVRCSSYSSLVGQGLWYTA